jgi:IS30 family transposase
MAHHHFTPAEQLELEILLKRGYSDRAIARTLGCSHTSIGREKKRNSVKKTYKGKDAKIKARIRRRYSKYQGMKVREDPALQKFIVQKLQAGWTPDEIAGHLKKRQKKISAISAKGIYKWLYSVHGQKYCSLLCSQQLKPKKRRAKAERSMIPNRVGIEKRPEEANNRTEYGHFETDTIVSGKRHDSTAALSVLHERKSRYVRLKKIPNLKPVTFAAATKTSAIDLYRRTITYDNGIENRTHEDVAAVLSVSTYFCNPYHSWEKGGVENTNGRIRRYIPKGSNLADFSDTDIAKVEHWLNHTPRKCLDWKTPHEIMIENNLFVSVSTSPNPSGAFEG